jgi:integrase
MRTVLQDVSIWALTDRRTTRPTRRPWIVRWRVDVKTFSRAFGTRAEADRFRSFLVNEKTEGTRFCDRSGLPMSLVRAETPNVFAWVRRWVDDQWDTAEPRTRLSMLESLGWFVAASVRDDAPPLDSATDQRFRRYVVDLIAPADRGQDRQLGKAPPTRNPQFDRRLEQHSPHLDELDAETLADVERRLRTRIDGRPRASSGNRHVKISKKCIRRAADLGIIRDDPWPPTERGRSARKVNRGAAARRRSEIRRLPTRAHVLEVIEGMVSHQPSSRMYQVMCRLSLDIGTRPSEVVDLTVEQLDLPEEGWGRVRIHQAHVGREEPGAPKTVERDVPLPPQTIVVLRAWLESQEIESGFLFRTRTGKRPTPSNWLRCLNRACEQAGVQRLCPYDLRHICATTMIASGVPLGETAMRLGHSVDELVRTYIGAFVGDEELGNHRLEAAFDQV